MGTFYGICSTFNTAKLILLLRPIQADEIWCSTLFIIIYYKAIQLFTINIQLSYRQGEYLVYVLSFSIELVPVVLWAGCESRGRQGQFKWIRGFLLGTTMGTGSGTFQGRCSITVNTRQKHSQDYSNIQMKTDVCILSCGETSVALLDTREIHF